jgi:Holliday junction resolvase-like predicted endonuclease
MPFVVQDLRDLIRLLEQHPEWRAELRRLVLTEEILSLPQVVRELAQEVRLLAEAQRRSEERLGRLEAVVQELAEAQRRAEERLEGVEDRLERVENRLERVEERLGRMEAVIGPTVEAEAEGVLRVVLEDKGYRLLGEPTSVALDGEVDVVVRVADAAGHELTAVAEAKARQSWRAVDAWASRIRSQGFQDRLRAAGFPGPYLVYGYGIRVDMSAERAARQFRIGLLSEQGERVAPGEPVGP